jgi:hypothetical protein
MALEVVWENPNPPLRTVSELDLFHLRQGMSLCIVHSAETEVVFRIDDERVPHRLLEVKRGGGA